MKKILVTGLSGFVGINVAESARKNKWPLLGLQRKSIINELSLDLAVLDNLEFLRKLELGGILHLAANSSINSCEEFPEESFKLNVKASVLLAEFAKKENIPFVFASSDQVFDGEKGNYKPEDEAKPLNGYGRQKLEAENRILAIYPKTVICRLPLLLGENGGYERAFVTNLKAGREQTLFTDEIRSVAQVKKVAQKLISALTWKGGRYHLGGPIAKSRYEIGVELAKKYNLDQNLLKKDLQSDVQMKAKRPKNVSMVYKQIECLRIE